MGSIYGKMSCAKADSIGSISTVATGERHRRPETIAGALRLASKMCVNGLTIGDLATIHGDTDERSGETPFGGSSPVAAQYLPTRSRFN